MRYRGGCLGLAMMLTLTPPGLANQADPATFELLRAADMRLASAGYRLSTAAASLCDRLEPGTGLQLQTLAQYDPGSRAAARAHFGMTGTLAVEGVVPGSPAERAGVRKDDTILSIAGVAAPVDVPPAGTTDVLVRFHTMLAAWPWRSPVAVVLLRKGEEHKVEIEPVAACFTRYELRVANRFDARADGELVQISSKYLDDLPAEFLPVVAAHELAHNILRHRERLSAAGADFGLASGFGRNMSLFRRAEIEADILSVHLLARAGYPLDLAKRFWPEAGSKIMSGMIRSRSHPPIRDRATIMQAEASRIVAAGGNALPPTFYDERKVPLSSDWGRLMPTGTGSRSTGGA